MERIPHAYVFRKGYPSLLALRNTSQCFSSTPETVLNAEIPSKNHSGKQKEGCLLQSKSYAGRQSVALFRLGWERAQQVTRVFAALHKAMNEGGNTELLIWRATDKYQQAGRFRNRGYLQVMRTDFFFNLLTSFFEL